MQTEHGIANPLEFFHDFCLHVLSFWTVEVFIPNGMYECFEPLDTFFVLLAIFVGETIALHCSDGCVKATDFTDGPLTEPSDNSYNDSHARNDRAPLRTTFRSSF